MYAVTVSGPNRAGLPPPAAAAARSTEQGQPRGAEPPPLPPLTAVHDGKQSECVGGRTRGARARWSRGVEDCAATTAVVVVVKDAACCCCGHSLKFCLPPAKGLAPSTPPHIPPWDAFCVSCTEQKTETRRFDKLNRPKPLHFFLFLFFLLFSFFVVVVREAASRRARSLQH